MAKEVVAVSDYSICCAFAAKHILLIFGGKNKLMLMCFILHKDSKFVVNVKIPFYNNYVCVVV